MSYWRKLFIVVLLVLSLPVQSFAAVSMACDSSHAMSEKAPVRQLQHHDHAAMMAAQAGDMGNSVDLPHHGAAGGEHHAHACSTCAACCFGGAFPNSAAASLSIEPIQFTVPLPPFVRVASFLTDGIERPPRLSLV
ncbi:hypothetical protein [Paraburkholderia sp. BL21I4N1]|uniref:hypothetical protein n=1 Tax=Paraburkholderia sp. BL21I4N1 TaxID=1938801 RepID=UPI000D4D7D04|nr:hypothetical protein [Paraburkholderia sp. BL21I4N1]PQV50043.1 hypothetical protein B0G83_106332 [Paraburkholderia sp. BL21I4N1]